MMSKVLMKAVSELRDPLQREFLHRMAEDELKGLSLRESMKVVGVGPERLVRWMDDEKFRGCWLAQVAMLELGELPTMLKLMRDRAATDEKGAAAWAKLWLEAVVRLGDTASARLGGPAGRENGGDGTVAEAELELLGIRGADGAREGGGASAAEGGHAGEGGHRSGG